MTTTVYTLSEGQYEKAIRGIYSTFDKAQRAMNQEIIEDKATIKHIKPAHNYSTPIGYYYECAFTSYWITKQEVL